MPVFLTAEESLLVITAGVSVVKLFTFSLLFESLALITVPLLFLLHACRRDSNSITHKYTSQREDCDSGALTGLLLMPLLFAAQLLYNHSQLLAAAAVQPLSSQDNTARDSYLFCVSVMCSVNVVLRVLLFDSNAKLTVTRFNALFVALFAAVQITLLKLLFPDIEVLAHAFAVIVFEAAFLITCDRLRLSFTLGESLVVSQAVTALFIHIASTLALRLQQISLPLESLNTIGGLAVLSGVKGRHDSGNQNQPLSDGSDSEHDTALTLNRFLIGFVMLYVLLSHTLLKYTAKRSLSPSTKRKQTNRYSAAICGILRYLHLRVDVRTLWFVGFLFVYVFIVFQNTMSFVIHCNFIWWTLKYVFHDGTILLLCSYWIALLVLSIWLLVKKSDVYQSLPNIVIRKFFHALTIAMFCPALWLRPAFMSLSFGVALSVMLLVELVRIDFGQYRIGAMLTSFFRSFTDARDNGTVILTHMHLLVGCAVSLWFSESLSTAGSLIGGHNVTSLPWTSSKAFVQFISFFGLLILGVGDSMASAVGIKYGKHKWPGSKKSIEGTVAAAVSVFIASYLTAVLLFGVYLSVGQCMLLLLVAVAACLYEAFSTQIDNLVLPIYFYAVSLVLLGTTAI